MIAGSAVGRILARYQDLRWDKPMVTALIALVTIGLILAMAASPAAGARMEVGQFYFAQRQALYVLAGAMVFLAVVHLSEVGVRRLGVLVGGAAFVLLLIVPFAGIEVKGATRWIDFGPASIQPSEFLKPGLVIIWAWVLAHGLAHPGFPARTVVLVVFGLCATMLLRQPDVGQTALVALTLMVMLAFAGVQWRLLGGLAAVALAAGFLAYQGFSHVRERVDPYLTPDGELADQVKRALAAIRNGGLFGQGPGEGTVKRHLPDSHSDFVYAVAGEEFGLFGTLGLALLFAFLVWRGLKLARGLASPFAQLAAGGLIVLFGAQAGIHMGVNLGMFPAKGMTLPLVSYGGSSFLGSALTLGMVVALTRHRPGAYLFEPERP
jgi:cell division protein FtsW